MNNFYIRSVTGLIFSALVVISAWLGPLATGLLFMVFAYIGLFEFYQLCIATKHAKPRVRSGILGGILLYVLLVLYFNGLVSGNAVWLFIPVPVAVCVAELWRLPNHSLSDLSVTLFGWLYVVIPFAMVTMLAGYSGQFEYQLPVGYFLILWFNDSGAYLFGRFLGKNKLYERVSPNKTWEGLIGGILSAFLVGYLLSLQFTSLSSEQWIFISLIISVFANAGDLFESHLKRNAGIKDSGKVIPGHGGVLDRFDGLFFSLPVVVAYTQFL